jgi:hypothetical protein
LFEALNPKEAAIQELRDLAATHHGPRDTLVQAPQARPLKACPLTDQGAPDPGLVQDDELVFTVGLERTVAIRTMRELGLNRG